MCEIVMCCPTCGCYSWAFVKVDFYGKEAFRCTECGEIHSVEEMEYKCSILR